MNEEQKRSIRAISDQLIYRVPPTPVEGEKIYIPYKRDGETQSIWEGNVTTFTLGVMLSGLLAEEEESSERR